MVIWKQWRANRGYRLHLMSWKRRERDLRECSQIGPLQAGECNVLISNRKHHVIRDTESRLQG